VVGSCVYSPSIGVWVRAEVQFWTFYSMQSMRRAVRVHGHCAQSGRDAEGAAVEDCIRSRGMKTVGAAAVHSVRSLHGMCGDWDLGLDLDLDLGLRSR